MKRCDTIQRPLRCVVGRFNSQHCTKARNVIPKAVSLTVSMLPKTLGARKLENVLASSASQLSRTINKIWEEHMFYPTKRKSDLEIEI